MMFLSWNILQGGGTRAERIAQQTASWQPDVVGLSEFRGTKPADGCTSDSQPHALSK